MTYIAKRNSSFHSFIFCVAVILYIIVALNSHGYYHADEHYQIIEFAGYKLGWNSLVHLAWEYEAQIRPAIQPAIAYGHLLLCEKLHITDIYLQLAILRIITTLLVLFVVRKFILVTENLFTEKKYRYAYILLSYFLWFIPFLSARFSSENYSGIFFLLGLALFLENKQTLLRPLLIGIVMGISFLFRYQLAFAMMGLFLWAIIFKKEGFGYYLKIASGFIIVIFAGVCIDSWFYGELVFTPWNYFYQNIVKDVASSFGTSPWYYYLLNIAKLPTLFIGIPFAFFALFLLVKDPKNIYLWCIIPFVFFHSIIPHKEDRFLFPMVYLMPVVLLSGYVKFTALIRNKKIIQTLNIAFAGIFVIINATGIAATMYEAPSSGRANISRYLYHHYNEANINLIYTTWANPYRPFQGIYSRFYLNTEMSHQYIENLCQLDSVKIIAEKENFLVIRKEVLRDHECLEKFNESKFTFEMQSIPGWAEKINSVYKPKLNDAILILYRYDDRKEFVSE